MTRRNKPPKRRRLKGRGALVAIASLLLASALIRAGSGAGQALARAPEEAEKPPLISETACETSEDLQKMLTAFDARESRLQQQETALRDRLQALKIADREIERKLTALNQAETQLRDTLALADSAAEDDLARLTKVYESMKPAQAAILFEQMDPQFAAGFLGRMRPESAAEIMAGLSPDAAHTFSVVLAGRNASVPKE